MKTITQLLAFILFSNVVFGQQVINQSQKLSVPYIPSSLHLNQNAAYALNKRFLGTRGTGEWLNYANDYYAYNGGNYISSMLLFPDTNIIWVTFQGNIIKPPYHSAATMLDPYNLLTTPIPAGDSYTIDSIAIQYGYFRTLSPSIADTLIISIAKTDPNLTGVIPFIGDTLYADKVDYDNTTNTVGDTDLYKTFKYVLREKDSTQADNMGNYFPKTLSFAVTIPTITPFGLVGASVSFKPGYPYSLAKNDSINGENSFDLLTSEENGSFTAMTYYPGNFNDSYVANTAVRYNLSPGSWNGEYIPTFAFPDSFQYENHYIFFHLIDLGLATGINAANNTVVSNGLNFYPNPTDGSASFSYTLKQGAQQVSLKILDVTGKELAEYNEGAQSSGKHLLPVNLTGFASGIYFYSFSADGQIAVNGKFVVR